MESYGGAWNNAEGEAVLRKVIEVPASLQGQDLKLSLGPVDDFDDTYFNGVHVGGYRTGIFEAYAVQHEYTTPESLIKPIRRPWFLFVRRHKSAAQITKSLGETG